MKLQQLFETRTVKGKKPEGFVEYLRSPQMVKEALAEHYPGKATIDNIVRLFSEHNIAIADNVVLKGTPESLVPYREYSRESTNDWGWTGKLSGEEFEELKADIKENGIKNPGIFYMERNRNDGSVKAYLGEGNHRLRIALELGLKSYPLKFGYYK
jgi:hypothetical protein